MEKLIEGNFSPEERAELRRKSKEKVAIIRLQQIRKSHHKTQKELAQAMGLSQSALSEFERRPNITVTAIIGRFLEHGRFYVFANKGKFQDDSNLVYIASADIMPRNLYHRVEAFIPLENQTVRSQVLSQVLPAIINDRKNSWILNEFGEYYKYEESDNLFCAHTYFMNNPSLSGQGSLAKIQT